MLVFFLSDFSFLFPPSPILRPFPHFGRFIIRATLRRFPSGRSYLRSLFQPLPSVFVPLLACASYHLGISPIRFSSTPRHVVLGFPGCLLPFPFSALTARSHRTYPNRKRSSSEVTLIRCITINPHRAHSPLQAFLRNQFLVIAPPCRILARIFPPPISYPAKASSPDPCARPVFLCLSKWNPLSEWLPCVGYRRYSFLPFRDGCSFQAIYFFTVIPPSISDKVFPSSAFHRLRSSPPRRNSPPSLTPCIPPIPCPSKKLPASRLQPLPGSSEFGPFVSILPTTKSAWFPVGI